MLIVRGPFKYQYIISYLLTFFFREVHVRGRLWQLPFKLPFGVSICVRICLFQSELAWTTFLLIAVGPVWIALRLLFRSNLFFLFLGALLTLGCMLADLICFSHILASLILEHFFVFGLFCSRICIAKAANLALILLRSQYTLPWRLHLDVISALELPNQLFQLLVLDFNFLL